MESIDGDVRLSVGISTDPADKAVNRLAKSISANFKAAGKDIDSTSSSMLSLQNRVDKAAEKVQQLRERQAELGKERISTEAYAELEKQASTLYGQYNKLKEKADAMSNQSGKAWQRLQGKISTTKEAITEVENSMSKMRKEGTASISGTQTDEYAQLTAKLQEAESQFMILIKRQEEFEARQYQTSSAASKGMGETSSSINRAVSSFKHLATVVGKTALNGFKKLSSTAKRAMTSINKSANGGLRTFLKYAIGVRSLFVLFNRLKQYGKEAFKTLAKQSTEVNADISMIVNSFSKFKNSIATAFQPLLHVVAPILRDFSATAVQAANAIGSFFAALTGQKYIYKATDANQDYAASLNDTANAAKKANKQLGEYDNLLVISQENASGGAGAGAGGTGSGFEVAEVDDSLNQFAEKLKEAWRKADFTEIGSIIGQKLTDALNNIPWDSIKEAASKIGKSIATFLNGVFETPGLFSAIGTTIGEALNTAIEGLYVFASNFHWSNLGKGIAESINSFFSTFDFVRAGVTLTEFASGFLALVTNAISGIDWTKIGKSIVEFISNIDWIKLFTQALTLAGSILSALVQLFTGIISQLSSNLGELFKELGLDTIAGFFNGLSEKLATAGQWIKEKFQIIVDAVKELFGIHSPSTVFAEFGKMLIEGLKQGITNAVSGIKDWIKTNVVDKVKDAFDKIKSFTMDIKVPTWNDIKDKVSSLAKNITAAVGKLTAKFKINLPTMSDMKKKLASLWTCIKNWINTNIVNKLNNLLTFTIPENKATKALKIAKTQVKLGQIPKLAQGAVIPPNQEFLAVLGDQRRGTNIEAPLDTIKQALKEVLQQSPEDTSKNQPIVLQLNGRQIAKVVWDEQEKRYKQTGNYSFG